MTGLVPYDAGKTEFVLNMIDALEQIGFKPSYFKPVAGHDGWYQYDTLFYTFDAKLLIGHDAFIVAEKLDMLDKLYLISPLDILTFPVDPVKLHFSMPSYMEHMSYIGKRVVLMRFTYIYGGKQNYKHLYYICRDTLGKVSSDLENVFKEILNTIKANNSFFIETTSTHVEKLLNTPKIYELIDTYRAYLEETGFLIIEGYNDVSSPTLGSLDVDYVVVVAPGKALLYSGERYRMAVELLSYRGYPWTIKASSVVEVAGKPLKIYDIPVKAYSERLRRVFEEIVGFITRED